MRCLQISKYYTPVKGGIETVVRDISIGLSKRGWPIEILCSNKKIYTQIDNDPLRVTRIGTLGVFESAPISLGLPFRLFRIQSNFDVIHIHLPNPIANLAVWFTRPHSKIVIHWHSDIINQKFLLKLYAPLQAWLIKRADAIIVTSLPYATHSTWLSGHSKKIHVVPICTVDPLGVSSQEERHLNAKRVGERWVGKRIVFALGRMTYYKGFDVLIKAARFLPNDTIVLIGGSGKLLALFRQQVIVEGLENKVYLLGEISDEDLSGYFQLADIFCLPSIERSEAFGVVILEAMGYGKPIVATNIKGSGVAWVNKHGESGLNAEPGEPVSLANCINCLLEDPILAENMAKGARIRFKSQFDIEKMLDSIEAVYDSIGLPGQ